MHELFVTPAAAERDVELLRRAAFADLPVRLVTERVLATLGDTVTPQGVVAVVAMSAASLGEVCRRRPRLVVVLSGVSDPGNAGAVLRTADATGTDAVVVIKGSVDPFNGKCVRASAGSLFHLPVVTGVDLAGAVRELKAAGLSVLAATLDGSDSLDDLDDRGELATPTAWLLGSEAHGLDPAAVALADRSVRVPMSGQAESLNLAAAAAICLYLTARAQRRGRTDADR